MTPLAQTPGSKQDLYWYSLFSSHENCWQTGRLGEISYACDNVGASYLPNGPHMVELPSGVATDVQISHSGDYCNYYNIGEGLDTTNASKQSGYTGYEPPSPLANYQEGNHYNPPYACQAYETFWGHALQGSRNGECTSPAPCGMQHYVSLGEQGLNDRPWSSELGEPSLVISADTLPFTQQVHVGAWGYLCPLFEESKGNIMEYCLAQWTSGSGFPAIAHYDVVADCASPNGHNLDQTITAFAPGMQFAENLGPAQTFNFSSNSEWHDFSARITTGDLKAAIEMRNKGFEGENGHPNPGAGCGQGMASTEPKEWALIGIEHGVEGGGLAELGGSEANLQLWSEYTPLPPEASTSGPSNVQPLQATLHGSVNPRGTSTEYLFKYGKASEGYSSETSKHGAGSGEGSVGEEEAVTLEPGTTYHYRIVAESAGGRVEGKDQEFKTPGPVEGVTTAASGVMEEQATLNGTVDPKGYDAKYYFQYGETTSYGSVTSEGDAGAGTSPVPESATVTKLPPGTTYHYRLVGTSGGVTSWGIDVTVRTLAREADGDPAVIKYKRGEVDLYWRGSKGELNGDWTTSKGWEGPTHLPVNAEGGVAGKLAVIQPSQGEVDIYWRASNGDIYGDWTTGSGWKGPIALPTNKECTAAGDPAVMQYSPTEVDVYWRGSSSKICGDWTASGTWHGPAELPNKECAAGGNPAVIHPSLTEVDVYWRGSKSQICGDWTTSKGWEGPTQLPVDEGGATGDPAVIRPSASEVDLYWRGSNNKIYGDWTTGNGWNGPAQLPTNESGAAGDVAVIQTSASEVDLYWRGSKGEIYGDWTSSGTWHGPTQLPVNEGGAATDPAVIQLGPSEVDLYWVASNNTVYGDWTTSKGWNGPVQLP